MIGFPERIVCLTEESVEALFDLGKGSLIVGVSAYVKRPAEAQKIPKVSVFTHAQVQKVKALKPDLILGFSDIQKDIARELIAEGLPVFISNQRSLDEILSYILLLGSMVGEQDKTQHYVRELEEKIKKTRKQTEKQHRKPRVYFEEWDNPRISGIRWVSELIELCGGIDIARELSQGVLAKDRFIQDQHIIEANPDIIFGCWCGKKVDIQSFMGRPGWQGMNAIKEKRVYELEPEIFLQPGPAPLKEGIDILLSYFSSFAD